MNQCIEAVQTPTKQQRAQQRAERTRQTLYDFDKLPDCARVPEAVVCALFSVSRDTAWVRVKAGLIPAPIKQGNTTRWVVGDLRAALAR